MVVTCGQPRTVRNYRIFFQCEKTLLVGRWVRFGKKNIFESPTRLDQDERMQVWEYVCTHNRSHAGRH